MEGRPILIKEPVHVPKRAVPPEPELGWYLLGWAGWVFLIAGVTDIALAFVPANFGNPEWEFGTITRSFDSVPLPFMGAALVMAAGLARGRIWWGRVGASVLALFVLWVLAVGVVYALTVPVALGAVTQPQVAFGLKKAISRTVLQIVFYASAGSMMTWIGARHFFKRSK